MVINYKELSDRAYSLHSANRLDEAEEIYKQLLEISPEDVNVLNLYGLLCLAKGDNDSAISLLSKALILKETSYIMSNLAKAYLSNGEIHNAIKLLEKAVLEKPDDDIYYSLAIAYKKINNTEKAIVNYEKALDINPKKYNASYNLSLIYKDLKDYKNAIEYAQRCLIISPMSEEIYALLSSLYELNNDLKNAVKSLEKAVLINPKEYLYYFNLGVLYSKLDKKDEAESCYKKVLEVSPKNIETLVNLASLYKTKNKNTALEYILCAYSINPYEKNVSLNLAQIYRDLNKNKESIEVLNSLINHIPDSDEAYSLLAINYMDLGEYEKALSYYEKAISLKPDNLNYLHGKSTALKYFDRLDEAQKILEYVTNKDSSLIQSNTSLGMIYLQKKEFEKGMNLYIQRSLDTNFSKIFVDSRVWNRNTILKEKTVLVYSDCGLGDTVMFARYLPILNKIAKKVILQTDFELVQLLKNSLPDIEIIPKTVFAVDYDVVIPIMNLALALNIDFNNIPMASGYLSDDIELTKKYCEIFSSDKKKIGLFRQGNQKIFKNRSIGAQYINQLTNIDKFAFYSMQKDDIECNNVCSLVKYINNYNDTASLLKNIDVLVTIDSSIIHIAGALGIKTYLMLPHTAEWRWFNDTTSTPWYDSVKIFRQSKNGEWQSVIDEVKAALIEL